MAAVNGNCVSLYIDNDATAAPTAFTGYAATVGVTSCSLSLSNATFEVTSITDDNCNTTRDFATGTTSGSLSIEGVVDESLTNGGDSLFTLCENKTQIGIIWGDGTNGFGALAYCTSFEISAGMDDFATFSASFEIDGLPTAIGFS